MRRNSDNIRADIAIAISELDRLLDPRASMNGASRPARGEVCPAVQLGIGIPKVRDTRLSVSEAKSLFNRGQHHAAEQAMDSAIERWSERP